MGVGAKDSPLLSSCDSSGVSVMLLRLCTVREVYVFVGGLELKKDPVGFVWLDVGREWCTFVFSLSSFVSALIHLFPLVGVLPVALVWVLVL